MADSNGGGYGFTLQPSNVGDTFLQAAQMNEQRNARRDSLRLQQAREKEENDWRKFQYVKETTDPTKYLSGQSQIDNHSQQLLGQVMQQALSDPNFSKKSLSQIGYELNQKVGAIAQSDLAAKQMYDRVGKQAEDAAKKNPNLDLAALKQYGFDEIGKTFLDNDGNYRSPDQIDNSRDIIGSALNGDDSWKFSTGDAELRKSLQNTQGDERSLFVGNPNSSITTYKGKITPFQESNLTPNEHGFVKGTPKMNFKTEKVAGVDVLPANIESQFLMGDDASKTAYLGAYNRYKKAAGIETTPQNEDLVRRRFGLQYVKDNIQNDFYPSTIEHLPRYNTTVNMGGKEVNVNDLNAAAERDLKYNPDGTERKQNDILFGQQASGEVQNYLRERINSFGAKREVDGENGTKKEVPIDLSDVYVKKENGVKYIYQRQDADKADKLLGTFDERSANFSKASGNTTEKQKNKVFTTIAPHTNVGNNKKRGILD